MKTHLSYIFSAVFFALLLMAPTYASASDTQTQLQKDEHLANQFYYLLIGNSEQRENALDIIGENWRNGDTAILLEIMHISTSEEFNTRLVDLMTAKTGMDFGFDVEKWYQWVWDNKFKMNDYYPEIKTGTYLLIDPNFLNYFLGGYENKINLNEVRWGGVKQDGIPPLRYPDMIAANDAQYLNDEDIVFGLTINGEARAYPKRILAWHEMFIDKIAGIEVTGVYCTLCGTMILYDSVHEGVHHKLGTSGFLYRSNKLMYDQETQSLWNTFWGTPVIGPLAEKNVRLKKRSVVVTTWGEWKKRHPITQVLALETGYERDYGEGVAYQQYFSNDELMFAVPKLDHRLKNKDEVIGLSLASEADKPVAISTRFLATQPIYQSKVGDQSFVVFTDSSGASRVYRSGNTQFKEWNQRNNIKDSAGNVWTLTENYISSDSGKKLYRIATNRAFWFGWYSAYPRTRLIDSIGKSQ